ncbi:MAG: polyketide synthase, partial [Myxococcota bacterium]
MSFSPSTLNGLQLALATRDAAEKALPWLRAEPIAVVGMACRFPGAPSLGEFRELLWSGRDAISDLPTNRWDPALHYDPDPATPGRTYVKRGGYIDDIDRFDADFFGISQREAMSLDPQQRMLLETSWEALEHASIAPDSLYGSDTGVFFGISN